MTDTRLVRVTRKWREAEDVFAFELHDTDMHALPPFSAGSHIDVHVPGGFVRQYSLTRQNSENGGYEIAVLREPASRGGSEGLCASLQEGDTLRISLPRNHFPLASAAHTLLFAGGIGVTPILCMAERLAISDASFEFHYCARSRSRAAFLDRISSSSLARHTFFHFDDGDPSQRLDPASSLGQPAEDTHLYVCGPTGFLGFIRQAAKNAGWADANVHFEYFSPPDEDPNRSSDRFEVVIASTGQEIVVEKGVSVVDALAGIGIDIAVSCEQGVCGSCITRVIEGEPDHRDYILSDVERAQNDRFFPCCSRSKSSRLVLDL